ncbi:MAG: GNAT family N-acetyltransferase [Bacteroidia bacterium]
MEKVIDKLSRKLLLDELDDSIFIRPTNKSQNSIYIFDGNERPNLMKELGRLREVTFRDAGGGTGKSVDVDDFDYGNHAYKQLIVWNNEDLEIVGGYRYIICNDALNENGEYQLSTSEILDFSDELKTKYFPFTIELGRSFVQPDYQPQNSRKGIFSLDNLWDGLGALVVDNPQMKYFFGKITMYTDFNRQARDLILDFMDEFFPDNEQLATPKDPIKRGLKDSTFFEEIKLLEYKKAYTIMANKVKEFGEYVPPLFNSYMSLSPSMKTFGTCINSHFGDVEETGILVTINDIYEEKKSRHIQSYLNYLNQKD